MSKVFVLSIGYVKSSYPHLVQKMVVGSENGETSEFPAIAIVSEDKYTFVKSVQDMAAMLWDASMKQQDAYGDGYNSNTDSSSDAESQNSSADGYNTDESSTQSMVNDNNADESSTVSDNSADNDTDNDADSNDVYND